MPHYSVTFQFEADDMEEAAAMVKRWQVTPGSQMMGLTGTYVGIGAMSIHQLPKEPMPEPVVEEMRQEALRPAMEAVSFEWEPPLVSVADAITFHEAFPPPELPPITNGVGQPPPDALPPDAEPPSPDSPERMGHADPPPDVS
jgi:hypothetical protein